MNFLVKYSQSSDTLVVEAYRLRFTGTAFAITGNDAERSSTQKFRVSIDGSPSYETSTDDTDPQTYMQWYQSPNLADGRHSVTISKIQGLAIDFMTVTPSLETPLRGHTLLLDDSHPSIHYSGAGWTQVKSVFAKEDGAKSVPFQNGTHQTSNSGDSFTFLFSGTLWLHGPFLSFNIDHLAQVLNSPSMDPFLHRAAFWNYLTRLIRYYTQGSIPRIRKETG